MTPPPPAPTLVCKDCGFSNEPERVYCHNCGAKLDRSVLPREENVQREDPDRARRRLIRMTNPDASGIKRAVLGALKAILLAIPASALLLLALPPEGVPSAKHELTTRFVSMDLQDLVDSAQPRATAFTEGEINAFLGSGKVKSTSIVPGVQYRRSFVSLTPGMCQISTERTMFGYSLYCSTLYRAEIASGVLSATNVGGSIGRLSVHPLVMRYLDPLLFGDFATSLKREYGLLKRLQTLHLEKSRVVLASHGAKK